MNKKYYCINCNKEKSKRGIICRSCEDIRKVIEFPHGDKSWSWKGNNISIGGFHRFLDRTYGQPRFCEHCFTTEARFFDWANISGKYTRERSHYIRLCRSCHIIMDRSKRTKCVHGHKMTKENTIINKHNHRLCKSCKKIKDKEYYLKNKHKWNEK